MKIILHRPIEGTIKTLTIRRSATEKWYACFSVEYDPPPASQKEMVIGVDVGLESSATLSTGEKIENPRPSGRGSSQPYRRDLRGSNISEDGSIREG